MRKRSRGSERRMGRERKTAGDESDKKEGIKGWGYKRERTMRSREDVWREEQDEEDGEF